MLKCCICDDVFDVGCEMPNGDYVCATQECCYEYCKYEGKRITQGSEDWVSVSERLPKDTRAVLVWDPLDENIYTMCWQEGQWFLFGGRAMVNYKITHWKSLPEPPKGD